MGTLLRLHLADEAATLALGRAMAGSLPPDWETPRLYLRGGLGSGKTTLARGFVSALPGGGEAEVASPSFNLANIYPTRPRVVHVDLYRLGEGVLDASLEEYFDPRPGEPPDIVLVEWAENLPEAMPPADHLDMEWIASDQGREVLLRAEGPHGERWLESIRSTFKQSG